MGGDAGTEGGRRGSGSTPVWMARNRLRRGTRSLALQQEAVGHSCSMAWARELDATKDSLDEAPRGERSRSTIGSRKQWSATPVRRQRRWGWEAYMNLRS